MRIAFLVCLFLWAASAAFAQEPDIDGTLRKVEIDSVRVTGRRTARAGGLSVGARVSAIGEQVLAGNLTHSLSELISNNSTVYIKTHGQGMLATASFRGTGSRHTQVNWNGVTINPSLSGSFDFSQVPVFFVDDVTLYHGGNYLKNGTGALGGSINLGNGARWEDSTRLKVLTEVGAYGTYTGGVSTRFVREKALYQTRLYYQQSENDYRYLNKVRADVPFYENRKEAQYKQGALMQEAYFRPGRWSTVSTNLWVHFGGRHFPQPVTNAAANRHQKQDDLGVKYLLEYAYARGRHDFSVKGAYVFDRMDYVRWFGADRSREERSLNNAHAFHVLGDYTYRPSGGLELAGALRYTYDLVAGGNFAGERFGRNQFSFLGGARWQALDWLTLDGRAMGEMTGSRLVPTFSAGIATRIVGKLSARASVARNYKFPAMNDLYWYPHGNPDLLPERGYSYDATLSWTPRIGSSLYLRAEATYYRMNVRDWILWLPHPETDLFTPLNIAKVLSHGVELRTEATLPLSDWELKLGVNYAYSPSLFRGDKTSETYNRQLPYVPLHKVNARFGLRFRGLFFSWLASYNAKRYTGLDDWRVTNAYLIHDAEVGYEIRIAKRYTLTPRLRADNILNAYYESIVYYPMPRRLIAGSVTFTF